MDKTGVDSEVIRKNHEFTRMVVGRSHVRKERWDFRSSVSAWLGRPAESCLASQSARLTQEEFVDIITYLGGSCTIATRKKMEFPLRRNSNFGTKL